MTRHKDKINKILINPCPTNKMKTDLDIKLLVFLPPVLSNYLSLSRRSLFNSRDSISRIIIQLSERHAVIFMPLTRRPALSSPASRHVVRVCSRLLHERVEESANVLTRTWCPPVAGYR